jgi:hypothetical protein
MSATNAFETALLQLLFNNADLANVGDAGGLQNSASAGSFFVSLHTSDPGEAGGQATNEANFTGYARVAVARSDAGWTIAGNMASNAAAVNFPVCTGGNNTVTHFGIGSALSGAGSLFFKGALDASLAVSAGIAVNFPIGELKVTLD